VSKFRLVALLAFATALVILAALGGGWKWRSPVAPGGHGNGAGVERVAGWTWDRAWRA
jgi:hypothetical protein